MLRVTVLCVGTLKEDYLRAAASEYQKRLGAYCTFAVKECREERELLPFLQAARAYKIALCVEGRMRSSEELAELLGELPMRGHSSVIFVIGDSDGMRRETKEACDLRLSFSPMTFPHQLMRIILMEQIYRCMNINGGGKYHK